jgi:chaperonin GroEL (HSP60 family)
VASECYRAYAEALELIPYTLAQNAGLSALETVCRGTWARVTIGHLVLASRSTVAKHGAVL